MTDPTNENNAAVIQAAQANSTLNSPIQPLPQESKNATAVDKIGHTNPEQMTSLENAGKAQGEIRVAEGVTSTGKTRETEDQKSEHHKDVDKDGDGIIDAYDKEIKSREDISEEMALLIQDMKNAYGKKMWDMAQTLRSVKSMLKTITGTEVSDKVANSVFSLLKRSGPDSNKGPGGISSVGSLGEDKTKAESMDVAS